MPGRNPPLYCTLILSPSRATNHDKKYVPTRPHTALCVRGTGGKEDTFVEEATVTFTKNVLKYRESTQSELVTSKLYKLGKYRRRRSWPLHHDRPKVREL